MSLARCMQLKDLMLSKRLRGRTVALWCRHYAKEHRPPPKCDTGCVPPETGCPKTKRKGKKTEFQFYHLVGFPKECCEDPCIDTIFPRFDECYYKESDKAKRKYQITWTECPPIQIKPKKICCFEKAIKPPIIRRKKKPKTACEQEPTCDNSDCPKWQMPGCRPARNPPICNPEKVRTDCKKVKAPYPAFSECSRPDPRPRRKIECNCLDIPMMCEILEELERRKRKGTLNKGPCGS